MTNEQQTRSVSAKKNESFVPAAGDDLTKTGDYIELTENELEAVAGGGGKRTTEFLA